MIHQFTDSEIESAEDDLVFLLTYDSVTVGGVEYSPRDVLSIAWENVETEDIMTKAILSISVGGSNKMAESLIQAAFNKAAEALAADLAIQYLKEKRETAEYNAI